MRYIDAHAHVYSTDDTQFPPIESPTRPPGQSGTFGTLGRLAEENHVFKLCVVQPSSYYGWDNRFICSLAMNTRGRAAAICTPDPDDPQSAAGIGQMVREFGIRGIRSLPASNKQLDHAGVRAIWRACADHDLTINVFIQTDKEEELRRLLQDFPGVRCVIDHCLLLSADTEKKTLEALRGLASFPNAFAKLSFLPLGSGQGYPYLDLHRACHTVIDMFSPQRCVWGSNFPCELWTPKSTYRQNLSLFTSELGLSSAAQEDILWNTPSKLWFDSPSS